jgi:transposase
MIKKDKKTDVSHLFPEEKTDLIYLLLEKNNLLIDQYNRLETKFKWLEAQLAKNSSNSSKPPSSDTKNPKKKSQKTASLKKKSDKKPGGQPGHAGKTLQKSTMPDETVWLPVDECIHCGKNLKREASTLECRQEFEIPKPVMWVTEFQAQTKHCPACRCTTAACFPKHITHTTQYGPRAKSLMVYLNQYQLIPFNRAAEFFNAVYHQPVSPGTIVNAVGALSIRLDAVDNGIKHLLIQSKLLHCDETGTHINGNKQWLHTVGTKKLTHYAVHEKRGQAAMDAIGILPHFKGTLIHDHWKSYFAYKDVRHGLCNAHHLRELKFLDEHQNMTWAKKMSDLLLRINAHKEVLVQAGRAFNAFQRKNYNEDYDEIISKAGQEQARRGSIESHNLLKRLKNYKACVLLFMNE